MAQVWSECTWKITNYGRLINQFSPNNIKWIRQIEKINTKIPRQKCLLMFIQIYTQMYILRIA